MRSGTSAVPRRWPWPSPAGTRLSRDDASRTGVRSPPAHRSSPGLRRQRRPRWGPARPDSPSADPDRPYSASRRIRQSRDQPRTRCVMPSRRSEPTPRRSSRRPTTPCRWARSWRRPARDSPSSRPDLRHRVAAPVVRSGAGRVALFDVPHHLVELILGDLAARVPPSEDLGRAVMVPAVHRIAPPAPPAPAPEETPEQEEQEEDEDVSTISLDDAPPEGFAHLDHLDSGERAEERCRDHGRDRNDDARMVETVPGLRVSAAGPDDAGGPAEEAGRRPLRAHREGEGRGRVAFRDAGPETADGRGHAERDAGVRLVPGRPEPFRSVEDCPVPRQDQEHRGAPRRPRRDWQVVAFDGFSSEAASQPPMLAARFLLN